MKKLAVFGSGSGSNFEAIVNYFKGKQAVFSCISNKKESYILKRAKNHNIENFYVPHKDIVEFLQTKTYDLIVLAGYMRLIPEQALNFGKFINIHPSLLPAYKGLNSIERAYNDKVKITGVTVHFVDEGMDSGPIIAQVPLSIKQDIKLEELEKEIHQIEHKIYPAVIDKLLFGRDFKVKVDTKITISKGENFESTCVW